MKKLALAVLLSTIGAGAAQAQTAIDLAGARLLFQGKLNISTCTIDGAVGATGDKTILMPGSLGVRDVGPLAAATSAAFDSLKDSVKYDDGAGYEISIVCPTDANGVYGYISGVLGGTPDATAVAATFNTRADMYFYGTGNGASGFIPQGTNPIGVLAADSSSPNSSVGIAIRHNNPRGASHTPVMVNLDPALSSAGVPILLDWRTGAAPNTIEAVPSFAFAYVPASVSPVLGGVTTATLPFKIIYK